MSPAMRTIYDFPANASNTEGAKEVAQLAAFRAVQEFAFEPVMQALTRLQSRVWDPDQPFLIAEGVRFDWKTAPIRKYASFEDFYHRELETTWGKWSDLQETYRRRMAGQLTEEQAQARIQQSRAAAIQALAADPNLKPAMTHAEAGAMGGRGKKAARSARSFRHDSSAGIIARLKRDHPDIAERLAAGEFPSARAAARAAGITVDTPPLTILRRAWRRASLEEQAVFRAEITELVA